MLAAIECVISYALDGVGQIDRFKVITIAKGIAVYLIYPVLNRHCLQAGVIKASEKVSTLPGIVIEVKAEV